MARKFAQTSRYPNGFSNGVEILGERLPQMVPGNVYWVSATDGSDGNKGTTRERPFATLSKAMSACASGGGDMIFLAPGHKETLADAVSIVPKGVNIVGLGHAGQKPRFLLSGGNASDGFDIAQPDVTIQNITYESGVDGNTGIDVDATGVTLRDITFKDNATDLHFVQCIQSGSTTDNVCDDLTVEGCEYHTATDSNTAFMSVVGDIDRMKVVGNTYTVSAPADTSGILINGTAGDDMQAVQVIGNHFISTVSATDTYVLIAGNAESDNTGVIADNYIGTAKAATNATNNMIVKGTGFRYFQNYIANDITDGSSLHPTAT